MLSNKSTFVVIRRCTPHPSIELVFWLTPNACVTYLTFPLILVSNLWVHVKHNLQIATNNDNYTQTCYEFNISNFCYGSYSFFFFCVCVCS